MTRFAALSAYTREHVPVLSPPFARAAKQSQPAIEGSAERHGMRFRPDVDGLRAVAVLLVLAYHLRSRAAGGGFIGVDIFFVISGFVINGSILARRGREGFSIAGFYKRRVLRIAPELLLVITATVLYGLIVLYPGELVRLSAAAVAALLSVANIWFYSTTSYFTHEQASDFLLHTWSLGIEEQFYFFFPLIIMATGDNWQARLAVFLALSAVSLALASVGAFIRPEATFYLLPTRAWELMLGALTAETSVVPQSPRGRAVLAGLGALGIISSTIFITDRTPFPGLAALPACLGASAIIIAGTGGATIVSRVLASRPLVVTGALSYALYLWHMPLIVAYNHYAQAEYPTKLGKAMIVLLSFALAAGSTYLLEAPIRRSRAAAKIVFLLAGVAATPILILCAAIIGSGGFAARFQPRVAQLVAAAGAPERQLRGYRTCFLEAEQAVDAFDQKACLIHMPKVANILVIGDSTAAALARGLEQPQQRAMSQITAASCPPTVLVAPPATPGCKALMALAYRRLIAENRPDLVVMLSRWKANDVAPLIRTSRWFKVRGVKLVLLGQLPSLTYALPPLLADAARLGRPVPARLFDRARLDDERTVEAGLRRAGVPFVALAPLLCPRGVCRLTVEGAPVYFDRDHLSLAGARHVVQLLQAGSHL